MLYKVRMREALEQAKAVLLDAGNGNPRRDAELLLLHVTGKTRDLTGHVLDKFVLADCPKPCGVPMADP